ncbi:MAG: S1 RNA-binding domain-containing protein [Anaerolineae bacterium]|nr:S1 RNA-binding domain-containing protein [Anaerolineae bacterium]MCI0607550.1 S1 RNA-binding domain-containing protein [Anaerolineae bacterium]
METPNIASETTLTPKTKLSGKVLKTTLAGALVDVGQNIPGVIHISQLSEGSINKVEDVVREGQTVDVWVRRVKKDRIELTMIKPLGLEWKEIEPDMVVKGKIVRLEPYGAFVDIGAERPGMVHVSELAHGYVKTPNEVVKEGDEVEAKVLDVNRKKKQIKLSMKALESVVEEFKPAKKEEHKSRSKRGPRKEKEAAETVQQEEPKEPELTGMQVAWQEALNKANAEKSFKVKRVKSNRSQEQEDILNRTLEKRLPTGG